MFTNSPNIGMPIPQVSGEPGPQYATDVNQCLNMLDFHGHGPGLGNAPPIGSLGINIQSDLSFNIQNATSLRTARFVPTTATSGTDIGCVYVRGADLFYNDLSGNVVRITQNGGLSTSSQFQGLIATTAIVSAAGPTPATSGFVRMNNNLDYLSWRNAANNADDRIFFDGNDNLQVIGGLGTGVQANNFKFPDTGGNGKVITIQAPVGSSAYTIFLPSNASSGPCAILMSSSGAMNTGVPITGGMIAGNTIDGPNIVNNVNLPGLPQANSRSVTVAAANPSSALQIIRGGYTLSATSAAIFNGEGFTVSRTGTGTVRVDFPSTPYTFQPPAAHFTALGSLSGGTSFFVFPSVLSTCALTFQHQNLAGSPNDSSTNNFIIAGLRG